MATHSFLFSSETEKLSNGRVLVRGARTSSGGRKSRNIFIQVECLVEDANAVAQALATILRRDDRIEASSF